MIEISISAACIEAFPYTRQPATISHYQKNNSTETITIEEYGKLEETDKSNYSPVYVVNGRDGRILSEDNLALLISKLTNNSSYVISDNVSSSDNDVLEFILEGRYFKINKAGYNELIRSFSTSSDIYANIVLQNTDYHGYAVMKGPLGDVFKGINFTDTSAAGALHLLTKIGSAWVIPTASKFRFTSNVVGLIDGGTV